MDNEAWSSDVGSLDEIATHHPVHTEVEVARRDRQNDTHQALMRM